METPRLSHHTHHEPTQLRRSLTCPTLSCRPPTHCLRWRSSWSEPVSPAHRSYEQAVNSPKRELRIFTPEEGATEHIGLDHLPHVSTFIADWVADTFTELTA